jgi:uncharacterized protein YceH (UPF0502 family)
MAYTRPLDAVEVRILGALMEKERTTPEQYPLTVASLLQACNQKTSRDPVTDYSETVVVEALDRLRADALVFRVHGSRSERYEHCLDRRWNLDTAGAAAIISMLLLRGPQTVAELKTRTTRLHPFDSAEQVEAALARLATGEDALTRELPRQPGQRETRWIHLTGTAEVERELVAGFTHQGSAAARPAPAWREADSGSERGATVSERLQQLEAAVEALQAAMADLQSRLGD